MPCLLKQLMMNTYKSMQSKVLKKRTASSMRHCGMVLMVEAAAGGVIVWAYFLGTL